MVGESDGAAAGHGSDDKKDSKVRLDVIAVPSAVELLGGLNAVERLGYHATETWDRSGDTG